MRALGLLPARFAPDQGERILICLGTGTTAASFASLAPPITIVELSPAVSRLAARFVENHARWKDHARLVIADGRHFVETRPPASLGALTLEPLLPQAPGSVHLYSRGFYRAFARAAATDACCVQWLPTHGLDPVAYRALLRSFFAEFRSVRAWLVDHSTLLVGSPGELRDRELEAGLDAFLCGLWSREDWSLCELDCGVAKAKIGRGEFVVDDRPLLETRRFASGPEIVSWLPDNLELWLDTEAASRSSATGSNGDGAKTGSAGSEADDQLLRAARLRLESKIAAARRLTTSLDRALLHLVDAIRIAPRSTILRREHAELVSRIDEQRGRRALLLQNWSEALRAFGAALQGVAARPRVLAGRVLALWGLEERKRALAALDELIAYLPGFERLPELSTREFDALRKERAFVERVETARTAAVEASDEQDVDSELLRSPFDADSAAAWARGEAWRGGFYCADPGRWRGRSSMPSLPGKSNPASGVCSPCSANSSCPCSRSSKPGFGARRPSISQSWHRLGACLSCRSGGSGSPTTSTW